MTISSTDRVAGPFIGNDVTTALPFEFKVFSAADLLVVQLNVATGEQTTLVISTDYTVTLNSDQNTDPGGTVTLNSALATGREVTITSDLAYLQPTDLTNLGGFYPAVLNNALDRLTIFIQQLASGLVRTLRFPLTDSNPGTELPPAAQRANKALVFDEDGNVGVGVDDYVDQASNAAASAQNAADSALAAASSAAAAASTYDDFDDRYLGPQASDPLTNNDGDPLQAGVLYFNTTTMRMRAYTGTNWVDSAVATPASFAFAQFSGDGVTTAFTLPAVSSAVESVIVHISGVYQTPGVDYSVAGTSLTFTSAPPLGTNNVTALVVTTLAAGVPDNNSVSTDKIQNRAVTFSKLQAISTSRLLGRTTTGSGNVEQLTVGSGLTLATGQLAHANTSDQASVNNTGYFVIQDVTLDSFGHVAELVSVEIPVPDKYESAETALPATETAVTFTHGLGAVPTIFSVHLRNVTTEYGYAPGDEIEVLPQDGDGARIQGVWANNTVIGLRFGPSVPFIKRRDANGSVAITSSNWRLVARATVIN